MRCQPRPIETVSRFRLRNGRRVSRVSSLNLVSAYSDAQQLAKRLVEENLSYQFNSDQLADTRCSMCARAILHINLNTDHPIYDLLTSKMTLTKMSMRSDAFQASVAIRLLLSSWARMEDPKLSPADSISLRTGGVKSIRSSAIYAKGVVRFESTTRRRDNQPVYRGSSSRNCCTVYQGGRPD